MTHETYSAKKSMNQTGEWKRGKFFTKDGTFKFVASLLILHFSTVKFVPIRFQLLKIKLANLVSTKNLVRAINLYH